MTKHADRWVFLLQLAVLGAIVLALGRPPFSDQVLYVGVAHSLAEGHGFALPTGQPTAYITPGLPIAVAPFVLAFGSGALAAFRVFQALLMALAAWMGQEALRQFGASPRARVLAQLMIGFYPPYILSATGIYTETLSDALIMAQFALLATLLARGSALPARDLARGALLAFAIAFAGVAVRPTAVLVTIALLGTAVVLAVAGARIGTTRAGRRVVLALALAGVAGTVLLTGLWGARNQKLLGSFVPLSTEGAWVAFSGNDFSCGGMGDVETFQRKVGLARADSVFAIPEVERSRYFARALARELREHAAEVPGLWAHTVARLWLNLGFPTPPSKSSIVLALFNLALLLLAPRGAARLLAGAPEATRPWLVTALLFALVLTAAHVLTYAVVRYAFPALQLLLMLAAVALVPDPRAEPRHER